MSTEKLQTKRCGEYVALDSGEVGVWIIPPLTEKVAVTMPEKPRSGTGDTAVLDHDEVLDDDGKTPVVGKSTKTVQAISLAGNVPLESWTEVFRCFGGQPARLGMKSLQLRIAFSN